MATEFNVKKRLWRRITIGAVLCLAAVAIIQCCRPWSTETLLMRAIDGSNIAFVEEYLAKNGDPNVSLEYIPTCQATPLHLAARKGKTHIVRLLLNAGANPNLLCAFGMSPLRWTTGTAPEYGQLQCARLLLERGADPGAWNRFDGATIIQAACSAGGGPGVEIVKLLLEYGADATLVDRNGDTLLHMLAARGAAIDDVGLLGVEAAKAILEHGGNALARNHSGETALDLARKSQYGPMVELLSSWEKDGKAGKR